MTKITKIKCNQCGGKYNVKDVLQGKAGYNNTISLAILNTMMVEIMKKHE